MSYTDRIFPTARGLTTYVDELLNKDYQIPTFQRDPVWEKENVKKLWDSIYKFYPLGSILIWKTGVKLHNHRYIGGHEIADADLSRTEYRYILDGQQRTTSLLTSLHGGRLKGRPEFDPTVYVDLTVRSESETDNESYRSRFLFWDEIDDRNGEIKQNVPRKKRYDQGLIVKLIDIRSDFGRVERRLVENPDVSCGDYDAPARQELRKLQEILNNYRIPLIEIRDIQVAEVCQIFERVNQAGKPLGIFDIVVAKTFKPETQTDGGFYLRERVDDLRKANTSDFLRISDFDYLQILATVINRHVANSGVRNITDQYLNEIKTDQILQVWEGTRDAVLKTFDFFENHLHLKTPSLVPFRYFYMTITDYFYENRNPDYRFLEQYFWYYSFHNDDLLSNTTHLFQHLAFLDEGKRNQRCQFPRFLVDKEKLRSSSYSSKGRLSRAILALYASHQPRDWEHCNREVLTQNLFFSTDKPNLHHVFPTNSEYVRSNKHATQVDSNSLMNIVYLPQITNLDISNRPPLEYIRDYDKPEFEAIMPTHLLPRGILEWARTDNMPADALDAFVEERVNLVIDDLSKKLPIPEFAVADTRQTSSMSE